MKVLEILALFKNAITIKTDVSKLENLDINLSKQDLKNLDGLIEHLLEMEKIEFTCQAVKLSNNTNYLCFESINQNGSYTWFKNPGIGNDITKSRSRYEILIATSGYVKDGRNCTLQNF
jgi:hypothetical protein